jgi:hypothetical protein
MSAADEQLLAIARSSAATLVCLVALLDGIHAERDVHTIAHAVLDDVLQEALHRALHTRDADSSGTPSP